MKTVIHVNQHVIKRNRKTGGTAPVLTVKSGKRNTYAHEVEIKGPCRVVYSPDKPLSCGATVWIETQGDVISMIRESGSYDPIEKHAICTPSS